jgi:hypothetical protein
MPGICEKILHSMGEMPAETWKDLAWGESLAGNVISPREILFPKVEWEE